MVRALIVGQSGAGKSTITNCIFNNSIDYAKLLQPAEVARSADGCTRSLQNFIAAANLIIHDTVGFSDREAETPNELIIKLRRFFYHARSQFTHVFFVIPYGRLSEATQKSWALLSALFDENFKDQIHIILTHCDSSQLNVESFLTENYHLIPTNEIVKLVDYIHQHQPNHIICGSMLADPDPTFDTINRLRRTEFLRKLSQELEHPQCIKPTPKTFPEFLEAFFQYLYAIISGTLFGAASGAHRMYDSIKELLNAGNANGIEMVFHYQECPICLSSEYNNVTSPACAPRECQHIFHENCLRYWCQAHENCPVCKTIIDINRLEVLPYTPNQLFDQFDD